MAAPLILHLFIEINNAGVELCKNAAGSMGALDQFQGAGGTFLDNIKTGHILTTAIIKLAFVGLMIYFNILYLIRGLILSGLMAITPFLIWIWAITDNQTAIKVWFGEITSVSFMQFVHAFSILFFLSFIPQLPDKCQWWATFVALILIIPFTNIIRNIFQGFLRFLGINEEGLASGAMGMLGGLATMGKATIRPGGIRSQGANSPLSLGSMSSMGGGAFGGTGPFGAVSQGQSIQAKGTLANVTRFSPIGNKTAGALGTAVGMSMAAPLMGVNPGMASIIGMGAKNITQTGVGVAGKAVHVGSAAIKNSVQSASANREGLSKAQGIGGKMQWAGQQIASGIQKTATVEVPLEPGQYSDYSGMKNAVHKPASTLEAAAGLIGAVSNNNPIEGFNQGTNFHQGVAAFSQKHRNISENGPAEKHSTESPSANPTQNTGIPRSPRHNNPAGNNRSINDDPMQWRI